ncbi:amidohydrolase [uncultured Clostridium sp.]|uniref:amidohydrolase n=1 Tax=uncultured Clostridium sp. TaxID=59620 RepID=UPI002606C2ED|nr:amidohydrolase [uncultured Clostridium sp.]
MSNEYLKRINRELEKNLIGFFKEFHKNPELSNEEFETTKRIRELLELADIEVLKLPLKTGLVAIIRGRKAGKTVALRADIDGLPMDEWTSLDYKSIRDGKAHSCGHDFHFTSLIGAAYLLKENEELLSGNIKLIFQAAEETGHGAEAIIKTEVLDDVEVIFGLHNTSELDVGTVASSYGPVTAAVDRFEINIRGIGSHAASPEKAKDPIIVAANLISSIQTIISRNISPLDRALISVTHIKSGNTWNVIPTKSYMEGTVRTLNPRVREHIYNRLIELTSGISKSYGVHVELEWHKGPPATDNDEKYTDFILDIADNIGYKVVNMEAGMGGEDFAYYQERIKGSFVFIGTGKSHPHHHPKFEADLNAIIGSARYLYEIGKQASEE